MSTSRFIPFPVLFTPRFKLRELRMSDEKEIFILRTDEDVNRYIGGPRAATMEDVRGFIQRISDNTLNGESIMWAIEPRDGFGLLGTICLWNVSWPEEKAEIGYELLPQHQGKGILQEVMPLVIDYGFKQMGLRRILAGTVEQNVKSARLLEKHGFVRDEGVMEYGEVYYSLRAK